MSNPKDENPLGENSFNPDDVSFDDFSFDDVSGDALDSDPFALDSVADSSDSQDRTASADEEPRGMFGESLEDQDPEETVFGVSEIPLEGVGAPPDAETSKDKKGKDKKEKPKKEKAPKVKKEKPPKVKKEKPPKVKKEKPPKVKKEKKPKVPKEGGLRLEDMAALGACALIAVVFLAINGLVVVNGGMSMTNIMFLVIMDLIGFVMIFVPFWIYKGGKIVSVFDVCLGIAVLALGVGLLYLLAEWKAYDFTINSEKTVSRIVSDEHSRVS